MIDAGDPHRPTGTPLGATSLSWASVLDGLERDVAAHERLLDRLSRGLSPIDDVPAPRSWSPPERLGPLTEDLVVRAEEILARQSAVASALTVALTEVRARQRRTVRSLPGDYPGANGVAPAYIDVTT